MTAALLKSSLEHLLVLGPARWARRRVRGRTLVLAYHDIVPRGERPGGDRPLHLRQEEFGAQLDILAAETDIISLAEVDSGAPRERPRVVITFDDAYAGALTAGVEELSRRSLPATIFVAPGLLGKRELWWDALAAAGVLTAGTRARLLHEFRGEDSRIRSWARASRIDLSALPEWAHGGTEEQLRGAVGMGCSLAAHSWSHPNLATLQQDELRDELVRPLTWLRDRFPGALPWMAYPYGLESPGVRIATRAAGYVGAFLIRGGWVTSGGDRWALPRFNVSAGLSLAGFRLRLAGLLAG
jgi:peptidoglycan/xylan/chitin deacetylase (PgdA/CDA1 family)